MQVTMALVDRVFNHFNNSPADAPKPTVAPQGVRKKGKDATLGTFGNNLGSAVSNSRELTTRRGQATLSSL